MMIHTEIRMFNAHLVSMTSLPLLQWIVLIVARIIQISNHDYYNAIYDIRKHYITLQRVNRLAIADSLYDHEQLLHQPMLRTRQEMSRAQQELRDVFNEHTRQFRQKNRPDVVVDVEREIDEMFEWEIYLTDDIETMQMLTNTSDGEALNTLPFPALEAAVRRIETVSIFADNRRCYQTVPNAISIHDSATIQPDVLDLNELYTATISFLDTWAIDFLHPIVDETSIINAAVADAIHNDTMDTLNDEQAALTDHIMQITALSTSVVAYTLRDLTDVEWHETKDIKEFMKTIALRATTILNPLVQRQSTMYDTCRPRAILNDLGKSYLAYH